MLSVYGGGEHAAPTAALFVDGKIRKQTIISNSIGVTTLRQEEAVAALPPLDFLTLSVFH